MEAERRIVTGGEHNRQGRWPPGEQQLQLGACIRCDQLVQIVDHQQDGISQGFELRDDAPNQSIPVEPGCRRELTDHGVAADRGPQPFDAESQNR